jgi:hypothetical protein
MENLGYGASLSAAEYYCGFARSRGQTRCGKTPVLYQGKTLEAAEKTGFSPTHHKIVILSGAPHGFVAQHSAWWRTVEGPRRCSSQPCRSELQTTEAPLGARHTVFPLRSRNKNCRHLAMSGGWRFERKLSLIRTPSQDDVFVVSWRETEFFRKLFSRAAKE